MNKVTHINTVNIKSGILTLTLPETRKILQEKGYTGFKAYLYTGYSELLKLLFMPSRAFAIIHDNFDTFQYEKRVTRTRIVKTAIFSFSLLSSLAVFVLLLPTATPLIAFSIFIVTEIFSLVFFGIMFHALNNYIEDMTTNMNPIKLTFTLFSEKELDDKFSSAYSGNEDIDLEKEINFLTNNKSDIELLFKRPGLYKDGIKLRTKLQRLIEIYYMKANEYPKTQDLLLDMIHAFHTVLDSLPLQEALISNYERIGVADINDRKYEILKNFYTLNAKIFRNDFGDDYLNYMTNHRINNQRRIVRLFLAGNKSADIEQINKDFSSNIQETLSINTTLQNLDIFPKWITNKKLSEQDKSMLDMVLQQFEHNIDELFENFVLSELPEQIGHMYIKAIQNKDFLQNILSTNSLPVTYRLHALLQLSTMEANPFGFEATLRIKDAKISIPEDIEKEIAAESVNLLRNIDENKLFTKDDYFNSLTAEVLFTAAAATLHEKYKNIDLPEFFKQLQHTNVSENRTYFMIKYMNDEIPEYIQIEHGKDKDEYINNIKALVENIYKRNNGESTDTNSLKFKVNSKGFLQIMTMVRIKQI